MAVFHDLNLTLMESKSGNEANCPVLIMKTTIRHEASCLQTSPNTYTARALQVTQLTDQISICFKKMIVICEHELNIKLYKLNIPMSNKKLKTKHELVLNV